MHMYAYCCLAKVNALIRSLRSLTVTVYLMTRVWLAAFPAFTQRRNGKMRISLTAVI